MPTIAVGLGQTYATRQIAWDTLSGSDQGGTVIAQLFGDDTSTFTASGTPVNSWEFEDNATVYDFTAATEALLPNLNTTNINSENVTFRNVLFTPSSSFSLALRIGANNVTVENYRLIAGVNSAGRLVAGNYPNSICRNFVSSGGVDVVQSGFNFGCIDNNGIVFGGSDKGYEASVGAGIQINTDVFSFNNTGADYDSGQLTLNTCASEDLTGTTTGWTSAELVDFAGGDYRTKLTSTLATAGSGGSFIGCALESGGGGVTVTAESGNYSQVGTDTPIAAQLNITTTAGSYLLTGSEVNLTSAKKLIAETGSYDLTGTDVTLIYTPGGGGEILIVDSGVYSLAGDEVFLRADLNIIANSNNYTITGTNTPIKYNAVMVVDNGNYSLTGTDLNLFANYGMIVVSNSYTLTGTSVTLKYSGDTNQVIGTVTAGFAPDLYSAGYKPNTITVTFKG